MKFMQYYLGKWIFNFVFLIGVAVLNLPNVLTISRIVVIPVIFLSIYIHSVLWSILAGALFVTASITDYLDGYFARSRNQNSVLGRLLDPIADKLLVVSALVIVVANQLVTPLTYIPVIIIMCREVLVSGLREFLAEVHVGMPVTRLAKWKTGFQMTALSMILVGYMFHNLGVILLWVAAVLTFVTGYQYFQKSLDYVKSVEAAKNPKLADVKEAVEEIKAVVEKAKTGIKKMHAKKVLAKKPLKVKKAGKPAAKKTPAKRSTAKAAAKSGK